MARFLFVHGSWHESSCWELVVKKLQAKEAKHTAYCIDLPGHGSNKKPLQSITYSDYYLALKEAILSHSEPVYLVAHSMAGILAGPLLEELSEQIAHVFFIAAYLPQKGKSLSETARSYDASEIPKIITLDPVNNTFILQPDGAKRIFYHDCSDEIQNSAALCLQPQPIKPLQEPILCAYSEKLASKRTYIICEKDRAVCLQAQRDMSSSSFCSTLSLSSGHFPFLSQPEVVAEILISKSINY